MKTTSALPTSQSRAIRVVLISGKHSGFSQGDLVKAYGTQRETVFRAQCVTILYATLFYRVMREWFYER